ncbi:DUF805 domain-containing protein, partial [Akkermansiaceae bacterium]|nr:DUF805 domain-containing protein [Akkermansiaceae bacterium]
HSSPHLNNRLNLLFSFKGRINRKQFILGYLLKWALVFVVGVLFIIFEMVISNDDFLLFLLLPVIPIIWLNLALIIRRLKDTGSSPWILILLLIPWLNLLLGPLIILLCMILPSGKKEAEKYGDAPYDIF